MTEVQRKKGLSGLDKVLIGCGIGCVGLIVLVALGAAIGGIWFFRPGEQHPVNAVVGADSFAVLRLRDMAEDPGTQALLTKVIVVAQELDRRQTRQQLPESMRWLTDLQQPGTPAGFNMMLPREVAVAFEPGEGGDPAYVLAANFRTMVRPIKALWSLAAKDSDVRAIPHGEHRILDMGNDALSLFVDSTLLFSNSLPQIRQAVDRLESGATGPSTGAVPAGDWDLTGTMDNTAYRLSDFLEGLPVGEAGQADQQPPEASEALAMAFGIDIATADAVQGRLVLRCAEVSEAIGWMSFLQPRLAFLGERAREQGLVLETRPSSTGTEVTIAFDLSGLEARIEEIFAELEANIEGTVPKVLEEVLPPASGRP